MKIFKNFKTRKQLKAEIEELNNKLNGERVCSVFCKFCKNSLERSNLTGTYYDCLLDCHCKDFERKESEEE